MKAIGGVRYYGMDGVFLLAFYPVKAVSMNKCRSTKNEWSFPLSGRGKLALNALGVHRILCSKAIDTTLLTNEYVRRVEPQIRILWKMAALGLQFIVRDLLSL